MESIRRTSLTSIPRRVLTGRVRGRNNTQKKAPPGHTPALAMAGGTYAPASGGSPRKPLHCHASHTKLRVRSIFLR